jgi:hypothetical protein
VSADEDGWVRRRVPKAEAAEKAAQAALIRDVFGGALRPLVVDRRWLRWDRGAAATLAKGCYEDRRLPAGSLDAARLAVLADALEEAGCADVGLLGHLRGPGPHVRGCWALDLILGKG